MNLNQAIASGKRFARSADASMGDYVTADEFLGNGLGIEDYNATDFELEPDAPTATVALSTLVKAWNDAKGSSTHIATAESSGFFSRLVGRLEGMGININKDT
jgi:hypothetical protein